jgi:hypothetical protein
MLPTNRHWAHVVGYGPFSLCVNRLTMMMMKFLLPKNFISTTG